MSSSPGDLSVAQVIRDVICEILPDVDSADITGKKTLQELGADSVERVEIFLSIMDRLSCTEPLARVAKLPNIESLTDYLDELSKRRVTG